MKSNIPAVQSGDRLFNQLQGNISKALQPIFNNPINYGVLLSSVDLVTGQDNEFAHTLNRKLQGWFPIRVRSQATIWDSQDGNSNPTQTLILNTSADVTVDLWVF